jgi:hypothetical protein
MSNFFIVKGELAAWALGLEDDDRIPAADIGELELFKAAELPRPKRHKRRLGHAWYRQPFLRQRQLAER